MTVLRVSANGGNQSMPDCWFPVFLNQRLKMMGPGEEKAARDWITEFIFEDALRRRSRAVNVTQALRQHIPNHPYWSGTPMEPLWECTRDEEQAAWVYGNLVCRVGVERPDTWWVYKISVGFERSSSIYIYDHE
jgi:hypothetical protein